VFLPGHKKSGGRPLGVPNKERRELFDMMAEKYPDYNPVISMIEIARDYNNEIDLRFQAHKEVAKYVFPQLKAVEFSGTNGGAMEIHITYGDDLIKEAAQVTAAYLESGEAV
jgi:hypothetical protein